VRFEEVVIKELDRLNQRIARLEQARLPTVPISYADLNVAHSITYADLNVAYGWKAPGSTQNIGTGWTTWTNNGADAQPYIGFGFVPAGSLVVATLGLYGNTSVGSCFWSLSLYDGGGTIIAQYFALPTSGATSYSRTVIHVTDQDYSDFRIYLQGKSNTGATVSVSLYTGTSPEAGTRYQAFIIKSR